MLVCGRQWRVLKIRLWYRRYTHRYLICRCRYQTFDLHIQIYKYTCIFIHRYACHECISISIRADQLHVQWRARSIPQYCGTCLYPSQTSPTLKGSMDCPLTHHGFQPDPLSGVAFPAVHSAIAKLVPRSQCLDQSIKQGETL